MALMYLAYDGIMRGVGACARAEIIMEIVDLMLR